MPQYTAQQGDCVLSIAEDNGFFWETVWNHPQNAALKAERKDPAVLLPGDAVFVPDKRPKEVSGATNQVHKYRVKNSPAKLKIRFLDDSDKPRANLKYTLTIDGKETRGTTDGEGAVNISIPPSADVGKLVFEDVDEEYDLALGSLDPVEEISGIQARLKGLGHYMGSATGELDDDTKAAIAEYQQAIGAEPTGEPTDELKNKLKGAFGS